jgi:translocation and assembly module TamB
MRRWRFILATAIGGIIGTAATGALLVAVLLYTGPGHRVLEHLIASLSDSRLAVTGLDGDLPSHPHANLVEVGDANGAWLRIENITLDWDALALFHNRVVMRRVTAARAEILRKPRFEESKGKNPEVHVDALVIPLIEIPKPVAGRAASLRAQGSVHYIPNSRFDADLLVAQLHTDDIYRAIGSLRDSAANGTVSIVEGANGILGALLGLPNLGPIRLDARAAGNRTRNAIAFELAAGALRASGRGTISLDRRRADIDVAADAPAMRPGAGLAWRSLALTGHVHGAFAAPRVKASLRIVDLQFARSQIAQLSADLTGDGSALGLKGAASGVRIPGAHPDIFAGTPITIEAKADPGNESLTFSLLHPLVAIRGRADTHNALHVAATALVTDAAPFAAFANEDIGGSATFALDATREADRNTIAIDGHLRLAGTSLVARLLGRDSTVALHAVTDGDDVMKSSIAMGGSDLNVQAAGSWRAKRLNYNVTAAIPDLSRVAGTLSGNTSFSGTIAGPLETVLITGSGSANMASRGNALQRIVFDARASGLPDPSSAQIRAQGSLDGSPITVSGDLVTQGKDRSAKFIASWKSLRANANFVLPRGAPVSGNAKLELTRLADVASFFGTKLAGSASATVALAARDRQTIVAVNARASGISIANSRIGTASVDGAVGDPLARPIFALTLAARNIRTEGASGNATAQLNGPSGKLAIVVKSDLVDGAGKPADVTAAAYIDLAKRRLALQRLDARWRGQTVALKSPATVDFARGVSVDRLVAAIGNGTLQTSGRATPDLAASLRAQDIPASTLEPFLQTGQLEGTLSGAVQLSGTLDAPRGPFELHGSGLRARGHTGDTLPPADLAAHGTLQGRTVALQATVTAGKVAHLAMSGEAPPRSDQPMNLRLTGTANLAAVQSVLAAHGKPAASQTDFLPPVSASGTLSIAAQLDGTPDAPKGSFSIRGRDLRAVEYAGNVVAPANLDASGVLHGRTVSVNATLADSKSNHVSLSGDVPLRSGEAMNLKLAGHADLAMLDPFLSASGRRMRGILAIDMTIAGTTDTPRASGSGSLTNGELQDFARNLHLKGIDATVKATGGKLHIANFIAHAGRGTIGASGSIDLDAPGIPVDIAFEAHDARPVESDLVTATFSGEVKMSGTLKEQTSLAGTVRISRAEINLPGRFPPQVAALDVRRRGQAPPPPAASAHPGLLDLTVTVPGRIFVRGRGMNAELDGHIRVMGTSATPMVSGRFNLERGTLNVAGQSLQFTTGTVGFDGTSLRNRLDPTLNFVAQTSSGGVTATLTVGGYASAPRITLSSVPQLPQDEVLARLLFNQSVIQLTPLQLAEIAQGLSALGGIGTGFDPVGMVRRGLGLDRLTFGSVSAGAPGSQPQTTLEAGKNIGRGLYLGARQTFSGASQLQVQYDITRNLKAQATASTSNSNPVVNQGNAAQDQGSSVGLSYQFEY